jgi:hypothetical protein
MNFNIAQRFARLRYAVAILGQPEHGKWWSSSFLTQHGLAFGAYNFPRASVLAGYHASVAAAKAVHDHRIGRRRCLHLFRLHLEDEVAVHRAAATDGGAMLKILPQKCDHALAVIEEEAGEIIESPAGPVQVGRLDEAFSSAGINEMAKHYFAAFRNDTQCLPFFSDAK